MMVIGAASYLGSGSSEEIIPYIMLLFILLDYVQSTIKVPRDFKFLKEILNFSFTPLVDILLVLIRCIKDLDQ